MNVAKGDFHQHVRKQMKGGALTNERAYRVTVGKYTYFVRVTPQINQRGDVEDYLIDVGGIKRGCVTIRVPRFYPAIADRETVHTAYIKGIRYDAKCSATRELENGVGTKHMVKTALSIIKQICPDTNIRRFRFIDTSRKTCSDGAVVRLPYFMIAMHGQTYYEKHFHAQLEDQSAREEYKKAIDQLQLSPRGTLQFADFETVFCVPTSHVGVLAPLYEKARTFTEFFQTIRKEHPNTACQLMQGWVDAFVIKWLFNGRDLTERDWIIPAEAVDLIKVDQWAKAEGATNEVFVESESIDFVNREQRLMG